MAADDEDTTAFHTSQGIYCYTKMPFGLKNAGETYQRVIDKAFKGQIRRNLEAYVDDLVIKSTTEQERSLPFFGTLKNCLKKTDFKWTEEAEVAFQEMKKLFKEFPTMNAPITEETLIPYLAASKETISSVLIANRGHKLKKIFPSASNNGPNRLANKAAGDIEVSHESKEIPPPPEQLWEMHTDGACGPEGAGAGIVLKSPEGEEYIFALRFSFPVTNNEAEYEALLSGIRVAKYLEITQVSRTLNKKVDALSKLAALIFSHFKKEIWVEEVKVKSIDTDGVSAAVEEEEQSWMTLIVEFLNKGALPMDSTEARKIKMKAPMYLLDKGILYRKSFLGPHLRSLNPTQAESIIHEVYEEMCVLHLGHKTVASKIMRLGYYWPSMYRDAAKVIRKCQSCQLHAPVRKAPRHPMIPVTSPCPFCKWAIDIVGPFTAGP
ncbi:uncharacterized protein [Rutidosis leptorrhynchoides]|uniref:uncharacterized protein n=1 Tax=Rutidosis leptorrhynchoides TaxID=125765 RepID=UPI003A98F3AF